MVENHKLTAQQSNFQGEIALTMVSALKMSQNMAKSIVMSSTSQIILMISNKVAACTSQSMVFSEHLSTCGRLTGLRNKPQPKQTGQLLMVEFW